MESLQVTLVYLSISIFRDDNDSDDVNDSDDD